MGTIKSKMIHQRCSCDNCNREMLPLIIFQFYDNGNQKPYVKIGLCEDCSNAVSTLLHKTMEEGKEFKYEKDEFKEVMAISTSKAPKPIEELDTEELCSYCSLTIVIGPESLCEGRCCDEAYQKYLEEFEEEA